jgi:hypothetical protein
MEKNERIDAIKERLTGLENAMKVETTKHKRTVRKKSESERRAQGLTIITPERRQRGEKVMMVLKWHKNLANEGRTVETDAGTQDIMLDAAIRLVKSLEEVDEKWKI